MGTPDPVKQNSTGKILIFFDGVCNLCNGLVNFLIDRDKKEEFLFASLQSAVAQRMIPGHQRQHEPESIIVIDRQGTIYTRSQAVFTIASRLAAPWKWFAIFRFLPEGLTENLYRFVAKNRYRWFGKRDMCRLPESEFSARFLSDDMSAFQPKG